MSKLPAPVARYIASITAMMNAEPTNSIKVSFIAAYSRPPMSNSLHTYLKGPASVTAWLLPQMPISRYMGRTAIS